jgi:hypothetical protein
VKKIFVYVEGATEERFVKQLIVPYLEQRAIYARPIGWDAKGKYHRVKKDLFRLLADTSAALVTTMLDYYGLPKSFPGRNQPQGSNCYQRVQFVEQALGADINSHRFRPYLTLHEFESLLFASPHDMAAALPGRQSLAGQFLQIRNQFQNPEEINDSPTTAAHARITNLYPQYQKATDGLRIVNRIGLLKLRTECPHFNEWLSYLETVDC